MSLLDLWFPPTPTILEPSIVHLMAKDGEDEEVSEELKEERRRRRRERNVERCRLYRQMYPEKMNEINRAWRAKNPERTREIHKKSRAKNRDKVNARRRELYAEKARAAQRRTVDRSNAGHSEPVLP